MRQTHEKITGKQLIRSLHAIWMKRDKRFTVSPLVKMDNML